MCMLATAHGRLCSNDVPRSSASHGRPSSPVEPKVVDEVVPVIQPNRPHAGSASLSLWWSAAVGGAAASYMKKLLFHVAVSALSAHQFLWMSLLSILPQVLKPLISLFHCLSQTSLLSTLPQVLESRISLLHCLGQTSLLSMLPQVLEPLISLFHYLGQTSLLSTLS